MGNSTFFNRGQGAAENESDFMEHSLLGAPPTVPATGAIRLYMDATGIPSTINATGDVVKYVSGTQANVDDAVSKKHTAGTDQGLDTGGANAVTAADVKLAVTAKHSNSLDHSNASDHTQGTDQGLDTGGANAVTAANVKSAVDLKHSNSLDHANTLDHSNAADHTQGTDTGLDSGGTNPVTAATIKGVTDLVTPGAGANSAIVGTGGVGHLNTAAGTNNVVGGLDNTCAGNKNLVAGSNQICGGHNNIVVGNSHNLPDVTENFNAVFGDDNDIAGACNLICGKSNGCRGDYNHIEGQGNTTDYEVAGNMNYTHLEGKEAVGTMSNIHVQAAGKFTGSVPASAQYLSFVAKGITTDATPVDLLLDGAAIAFWWQPAMYAFRIMIIGSNIDVNAGGHYDLQGMISREPAADTLALIGSVSKTVVHETTSAYDANVTVDDTLKTLKITVTGAAGTTLRWVAFVEMVQVSFAAP